MAADNQEALGLVETRGLIAAIEAADAMLKAASVSLIGIENTVAALMTVQISGETAAVRSAVDAGASAASRVGEVISAHVIPRPSDDVARMQRGRQTATQSKSRVPREVTATEEMTVRELRSLARDTPDLELQGREIARATKQQLLEALDKSTGRKG